ncbi:MAG: GNAT family N-acetyltransferase [Mycobacterium leprae]
MQPQFAANSQSDAQRRQAELMEQATLAIRRIWFGAEELPLDGAVCVIETGGKMLALVDAPEADAVRLVNWAADGAVCVVTTDFTRPSNLRSYLVQRGFRVIQRRAVYCWDRETAAHPGHVEAAATRESAAPHLLFWPFRARRQAEPIEIRVIDSAELSAWNSVCWRAFGLQGPESASLREKVHAFQGMGNEGRWYLAYSGGVPAGTAILHRTAQAAQILAVGTLPGYRRRGIATALVRRLVTDWLQQEKGEPLFLDTTPGSDAEQLYQHLGFRLAYTREVYAPVPSPFLTGS